MGNRLPNANTCAIAVPTNDPPPRPRQVPPPPQTATRQTKGPVIDGAGVCLREDVGDWLDGVLGRAGVLVRRAFVPRSTQSAVKARERYWLA